jgi:voltage-gated potassium channel Kch
VPLPVLPLIFTFARSFWSLLKDPATRGVVYLVIIVLLTGTFFYHRVEGWGWLDSLYFSVITLTTVGYGDFSPKTDAGKLFTIFYILVGLGILAGFISLIAQKQQEHGRLTRRQQNTNSEPVPETNSSSTDH